MAWRGWDGPVNQFLTIDLGQNYAVCKVSVDFLDAAHHAASYTIQTSTNNSSWSTAVTITGNTSANITHTFSATARYIKLDMTQKPNSWSTYAVSEFKIYNTTNQNPVVSITSPANSASFTAGSNITIDATATDADGTISKVEFYKGTDKLGEDAVSPFSYTWTNVSAGSYALTAVATDNGTGTTTSSPVNITVTGGSGNGWSLTGNAGTTAGTNFLGTTDSKDLVLKTNNTEWARLTTAGNLGLGTSAPSAKLSFGDVNTVTGPSGFTWYNPSPFQYAIHKTDGPWSGPDFQQLKVSWLTGVVIDPGNTYGKSFVDIQGNGLRVTGTSVGIGVTAPTAQLHTTGLVRFAGISLNNALTRVVVSDANGNLYYRDAATLGGGTAGWTPGGNAVASAVTFGTSSNYALPFITNNVERMRISASGSVGIGTASIDDNYKLFVEGYVRARKVKIDALNWPDYVFDKKYILLPITEVEKYIDEHHHLPEVPSAADAQKNGIDLSDTQATLLKKIEELTLYLIEQNKKLESQQQQLQESNKKTALLEKELQELKKRLLKQ